MILASRSPQQIAIEHAFDRRLRPHRHEDRGLDVAMRGVQNAGPRAGLGADRLKLEAEHSIKATVSAATGRLRMCNGLRIA